MKLLVFYLLFTEQGVFVRGCSRIVHVYDKDWTDVMESVWHSLDSLHGEQVAITSMSVLPSA